ncbi:MAG: hypothetical protein M1826_002954, partial [Phylliscum demangeonii]
MLLLQCHPMQPIRPHYCDLPWSPADPVAHGAGGEPAAVAAAHAQPRRDRVCRSRAAAADPAMSESTWPAPRRPMPTGAAGRLLGLPPHDDRTGRLGPRPVGSEMGSRGGPRSVSAHAIEPAPAPAPVPGAMPASWASDIWRQPSARAALTGSIPDAPRAMGT